MKTFIFGLFLLTTNAYSLDFETVEKECPREIEQIILLSERIDSMENDALAKVFMAAIRGYIYEAISCDEVEFGAKKIQAGLESLK